VVSGGGIAGWREDTAEMYRVRMGNGETGGTYAREKTSLRRGTEGGGQEGREGRERKREKGRGRKE